MPNAMHLLLVENDSDDAASVRRALAALASEDRVVHVRSVADALSYLATRPPETPLLMLLDMEAPDSVRLLKAMKASEALRHVPVIALTRSDTPDDILKSFQYGIAGYLVKPRPYDKLLETVHAIGDYWSLSQMPTCA